MAREDQQARETAWSRFADELKAFMDWRGMTARELAQRLKLADADGAKVRQWRANNGRPQFDQLHDILLVLRMNDDSREHYDRFTRGEVVDEKLRQWGSADWTYLARRMGIINRTKDLDGDDVKLAQNVAKLESRQQDLIEGNSRLASELGVGALVRRVLETQEWAVAIWPAMEGFTAKDSQGNAVDYSLYVADRVDFRRTDNTPIGHEDVWGTFEDTLKAVKAVSASTSGVRWQQAEDPRVSLWSIRRLGAPHGSTVPADYPLLPSVGVTSLTVGSWANDVADHLSRLIGYGLTSTKDLATELYGARDREEFGEERVLLQRRMLTQPLNKRVWSHFASAEEGLHDLLGTGRVFTVYLRESDGILRAEARRLIHKRARRAASPAAEFQGLPDEGELFSRLRAARETVDRLIDESEAPPNLRVVSLSDAPKKDPRTFKFRQCFTVAADVLGYWIDNGFVEPSRLESYWGDVENRLRQQRGSSSDIHTMKLVTYFRATRD